MFPSKRLSHSLFGIVAPHRIVKPAAAAKYPVPDRTSAFAKNMRTSYRAMIPSAGVPDAVGKVLALDVPAGQPSRNIPVRGYRPADVLSYEWLPILLFAHGGGFVSVIWIRTTCSCARSPAALVIAVDYRLAPEFPFPAGLEDVYAVLQWTADHTDELGGDARRIVLCGDSAGATLSAATPCSPAIAAALARWRNG